MKTKFIEFIGPNGLKYRIPLRAIAESYADYYGRIDGFNRSSDEWKRGVEFVMNERFIGIDWLLNNSNFEDWEDVIITLPINNKNNSDFWSDSDNFKIIEV